MVSERVRGPLQRLCLLITLGVLAVPLCQAGAPAGKVIIAAGEAYASSADHAQRKLKRRSDIFSGETLVTGATGRLQVRFTDGALLDLAANSALRIDDYRFDAGEPGAGRSVATLVKGGFRTITGLIGKQDPEAYRVHTPVATIGVRGTHYEARLADGLAVGVWKGGVRIRNEAGAFDIGQGASFNFAQVGDVRQLPRGLLAPPAVLEGELAPAAAAEQADVRQSAPRPPVEPDRVAHDEGGREPLARISQEPVEKPETVRVARPFGATDFDNVFHTAEQPGGTEQESILLAPRDSITAQDTLLATGDTGTLAEPNFVPDPISTTISDTLLTDARLSALERQRLNDDNRVGLMILSGPVPKNFPTNSGALTGGKATARDLGPVMTSSAVDPGSNSFTDFLAGGFSGVYRPGAAAQLPPPAPVAANPGYNVQWGAWDASPMTPLAVQTDANDPSAVAFITQPVFWGTVLPAAKSALDARSGIAVFNNVVAAFGHASGAGGGHAIVSSDMSFTAAIDFSTGTISAGQISIGMSPSTLPEQWLVNFTGRLNGPLVDIDPATIGGTVTGAFGVHAVSGDLGGMLTGITANALAGGFSFSSQVDGNIHAEGMYLVTE